VATKHLRKVRAKTTCFETCQQTNGHIQGKLATDHDPTLGEDPEGARLVVQTTTGTCNKTLGQTSLMVGNLADHTNNHGTSYQRRAIPKGPGCIQGTI
jgi:hypothetical protein